MKKTLILIISLVLLAPLAFTYDYDNDPDPGVEAKYYDDAKVLRVKYTQGEAFVKRSYDDGFEEAAINLPIFEKDSAGTTDGRLEVYMGRLNYLRFDYDTEVVFDKVPALQKTELSLKVLRGGIYLDIENLDYERDIEIQTADCGVFLLDRGAYRINVSEGGRTEIYVYDGIAEVAGDNYSRNVRENQKIVMFNGQVKERPFYFYSTDKDDFDRWNQDRGSELGYARYGSSQYLDSGYEEYEHELSRHGRWRYNDSYNTHIWIPYNVGVDWRPYYHGRWIWNPYYGYVWNSFDSWGYFTHHYGRWHWDPFYHWYWLPSYHWSPAWVSWYGNDYYYGWCPLSWWNRPVVVYNGHWWRNHNYRHGIPFHARSTTIIRKSQLSSSGVHRVALRKGDIAKANLSKKSLVYKGNAPHVRPNVSKVSVINARGKKVVYKKNSLVSASKYKVMKTTTGISTTKNKSPVYKYSGKKITKEKITKYSKSPYSKSSTLKSKSYKYSSPGKSGSSYKVKKYPSSTSSPGYKSKTKYRSGSDSSSKSRPSSSSGYKSKVKKSSTKSSSSKSKSSSTKKSSGSKSKTIKEKKEPSYSYKSSGSSSSYSSSSPYSGRSYSSKTTYKKKTSSSSSSYKSQSSTKSYKSSYKPSYKSSSRSSYSSSYKKPTKSYTSSSYKTRSSSSYKSYSKPSSSYKSYSRPSSSSYKSSSKSYSKPSSSYKSSSRSSSSYKSSSRSSSSSSSKSSRSSSSSRSVRKKSK
jgi:hypothetical protein